MKKWIATALAAAALTAGTAAMAQDLGTIIGSIFGLGNGTPAVVAGSTTVYQDTHGRRFYYDQYGRQVYMQDPQQQILGYDSYGRPIYSQSQQQQIVGYDSYGRPIYGAPPRAYVYGGGTSGPYARNDRDGDGVVNWQDRWPDDRRYR
jgi:hypothetical protein